MREEIRLLNEKKGYNHYFTNQPQNEKGLVSESHRTSIPIIHNPSFVDKKNQIIEASMYMRTQLPIYYNQKVKLKPKIEKQGVISPFQNRKSRVCNADIKFNHQVNFIRKNMDSLQNSARSIHKSTANKNTNGEASKLSQYRVEFNKSQITQHDQKPNTTLYNTNLFNSLETSQTNLMIKSANNESPKKVSCR